MNHFKFFDQKLLYVNKVNWNELTKAIQAIYIDTEKLHYSDHNGDQLLFLNSWLDQNNKRKVLKELYQEKEINN